MGLAHDVGQKLKSCLKLFLGKIKLEISVGDFFSKGVKHVKPII